MANISGVWGIDIGQCGLKAMRCELADDEETVVAKAFDYIEYPKILSQPEADPTELVRDALEQFLSRNEIKGDKIAISVSGQSGLARFFKPPPVDAKLIPNIVKYEAGQQIPFALEDVIWDYQQIGGTEVDGFTLDAEIGLFAMKREQVFRAIQPFLSADVELHYVQLAPLCVYNFICHEILREQPEEIDPDNPPESLVILSVGTETTDLVITNGTQLWQRSIPLGGNHFTKQLTKEMKLTFAKAEHLKRNAREAKDPKAVFQAMRPVFSDLTTEIQRSLGYFQSIDRQAKIGRMVVLGNATKLPGLKQYLSKNLGQEIIEVQKYSHMEGKSVLSASSFKDNLLSFPVSYGLCLQGLDQSRIKTNLLPPEFITERVIREKKPWAVATVGIFLLALMINYFFYYRSWWKVHEEYKTGGVTWSLAEKQARQEANTSGRHISDDTAEMAKNQKVIELGDEVTTGGERKLAWMMLLKTIDLILPRDKDTSSLPNGLPRPFIDREGLQIVHIESEYYPDLTHWYTEPVKKRHLYERLRLTGQAVEDPEGQEDAGATQDGADPAQADPAQVDPAQADPAQAGNDPAAAGAAPPAGGPTPGGPGNPAPAGDPNAPGAQNGNPIAAADPNGNGEQQPKDVAPSGPGWVIEIKGYHYHNSKPTIEKGWGATYVRNTLIKQLREATVMLPPQPGAPAEKFTMEQLGIDVVILAHAGKINRNFKIRVAGEDDPIQDGQNSSGDDGKKKEKAIYYPAPKCEFTIQFCWRDDHLVKELRRRIDESKKQAEPKGDGQPQADGSQKVASKQDGGM